MSDGRLRSPPRQEMNGPDFLVKKGGGKYKASENLADRARSRWPHSARVTASESCAVCQIFTQLIFPAALLQHLRRLFLPPL